jgi:protein-tyrosine-phosphatase
VYTALMSQSPANATARIAYVMDFAANTPKATGIPDPWSGGPADYEHALDQITRAVDGILSSRTRP